MASRNRMVHLTLLVAGLMLAANAASADVITIHDDDFDFVRRVNWGTGFESDDLYFSIYAAGDTNSAQQTFFQFSGAVDSGLETALGPLGPDEWYQIDSATLTFQNPPSSAGTAYLSSTSLAVTSSVNGTTYDGTNAYPGPEESNRPGTTGSYGEQGYLNPITSFTGLGSPKDIDITAFVDGFVNGDGDSVLFLTASPANAGTTVNNANLVNVNWGADVFWAVDGDRVFLTLDARVVPEPATWLLLLSALACGLFVRRRK